MKNKRMFIIVCLLLLFINTKVLAQTCSNAEKKELRSLANEAEVKYILKPAFTDYEKLLKRDTTKAEYRSYFFDIIVYNVPSEFTVKIDKRIVKPVNGEAKFENIYSAGGIIAKINLYYNGKGDCHAELIRTISMRLPYYNVYSIYPECKGYVDLIKICSTNFNSYKYTESEFREEVAKQIKKYEEIQNNKKVADELPKENPIIKFLKEQKLLVGTFVVLVLLLLVNKIYKDRHSIKIDLGDI